MKTITIDGREFVEQNVRVSANINNSWKDGDLYELKCKSVLPQKFVLLDETNLLHDLRKVNYHVID